jgi:hypothetical protein
LRESKQNGVRDASRAGGAARRSGKTPDAVGKAILAIVPPLANALYVNRLI